MQARIFVSYRRDDVAGDAGRLTDHLQRRFGKRRVFLDIDSIDPGIDFVQALDASLQTTAAMLVVIGPRWASLRDATGTRRLDAPDDFVVREVEAALRRGIPVVPVLMQDAALPAAADLPASIASLATRQTAVIDHDEFRDCCSTSCPQTITLRRCAGPSTVCRQTRSLSARRSASWRDCSDSRQSAVGREGTEALPVSLLSP